MKDLLREGLTNRQIGDRLGISLDGAKYHVSEIIGKLAVTSRLEAATWQAGGGHWWAGMVAFVGWPFKKFWSVPALHRPRPAHKVTRFVSQERIEW